MSEANGRGNNNGPTIFLKRNIQYLPSMNMKGICVAVSTALTMTLRKEIVGSGINRSES
jgi:hypothetical protein